MNFGILTKNKRNNERLLDEEEILKTVDELASSPKRTNIQRKKDEIKQPKESIKSHVAMDFTNSCGRIISDPKEANAIAVLEGLQWKKRTRPICRCQTNIYSNQNFLTARRDIMQPWFHSKITREEATELINKYNTMDGVFLIRESQSNAGSFVLTYKSGNKVLHVPISATLDYSRKSFVFSLDGGKTKFFGLQQLIEYYQLNIGTLPIRLTQYISKQISPNAPIDLIKIS